MPLRRLRNALALLAPLALTPAMLIAQPVTETLNIDARAATTPFPHFWEETFGSGRAILALRQSYRDDLRSVKNITGFESVRFHGIFNDDVGLYDPDRQTIRFAQMTKENSPDASDNSGIYNFSYIDQIYDGLLAAHVRPFVEMSFMPQKLSSDANSHHPFWYHPNVAPPKDYTAWDAMITAFAHHLIARYGIDEVGQWYFEVWNEPNLDFWGGNPKQPTYFELYDHTVRALKAVNPLIKVGGPATAQAAWVPDFLNHIKQANVPADFVSTHVYANDTAKDVFHTDETIPRDQMVPRTVKMIHEQILASPYPKLPLFFSEYNASYANEPNVTDTVYMGPWLATIIAQCDGLIQSMSYWAFSDVFEEQGVVRTPFYGGFGLLAENSIPKPAFNAFAMLHRLGDQRLALASNSALATRRSDGSLVLALWNYAPPVGTGANYTPQPPVTGPARTFTVHLANVPANATVHIYRVDQDHGNVIKAFDSMGRPPFPTRKEILQLRAAGQPSPVESATLSHGTLTLTVPAQGLALIEVPHSQASGSATALDPAR
jgi:xylan 1,4-beta-xylosidase